MVVLRSKAKSDDARMIKQYWENNLQIGGGILHDLLQDRRVEDVDILWCLTQAIQDRDFRAIHICGYMLDIREERDRWDHLNDILGWPTF